MGDRTYLQLTLHGRIRTVADVQKIVEAIVREGFDETSVDGIYADFAAVGGQYPNPTFEMQECNYANIDDLELVLQTCRVAWQVSHGAGGEYQAGNRSWHPAWGYAESGDGVIDVGLLRVAVAHRRTKDQLRRLLKIHDRANGNNFPVFSMAPEVTRFVATKVAAAALGVKE
jgi:hypothetical protein